METISPLPKVSDGKAKVDNPRRALGGLLGNAVRFRFPIHGPVPVMAAGEGLESILSLSHVMPGMAMVSALTANHLAAFRLPVGCERLYIAADADAAGRHGIEGLSRRAQALGDRRHIEVEMPEIAGMALLRRSNQLLHVGQTRAMVIHPGHQHGARGGTGGCHVEAGHAQTVGGQPVNVGCGDFATESTDIGKYDTCPHGCIYCYANINKEQAIQSFNAHDPASAFLGYNKAESDLFIQEIQRRAPPVSEKKVKSTGKQLGFEF